MCSFRRDWYDIPVWPTHVLEKSEQFSLCILLYENALTFFGLRSIHLGRNCLFSMPLVYLYLWKLLLWISSTDDWERRNVYTDPHLISYWRYLQPSLHVSFTVSLSIEKQDFFQHCTTIQGDQKFSVHLTITVQSSGAQRLFYRPVFVANIAGEGNSTYWRYGFKTTQKEVVSNVVITSLH